ncbi:MAG: hypothetical protein PHR30_07100 [Gallionellaceae bacterium]|nr:hypothetical protein [Gallionellaceae bacterium]
MSADAILPKDRFLATLHIVAKESVHLEWSRARLFSETINQGWVESLVVRPDLAERLEAFVSRYGRLQDTVADKLLPRWLQALAEQPGSQIEVLNRAERLGVLREVTAWLEARQLRNRLIHEYMMDAASFAEDLNLAEAYSRMLIDTYRRLRTDALTRMALPDDALPAVV